MPEVAARAGRGGKLGAQSRTEAERGGENPWKAQFWPNRSEFGDYSHTPAIWPATTGCLPSENRTWGDVCATWAFVVARAAAPVGSWGAFTGTNPPTLEHSHQIEGI